MGWGRKRKMLVENSYVGLGMVSELRKRNEKKYAGKDHAHKRLVGK